VARANPPEVVILDISMPGMDGYEVARQLRRMFQRRVVLIALTAGGFEEDKRRCIEAGFDRHFVKPADPCEGRTNPPRTGSVALGWRYGKDRRFAVRFDVVDENAHPSDHVGIGSHLVRRW
jgi:chemotaxis response regulator CheB